MPSFEHLDLTRVHKFFPAWEDMFTTIFIAIFPIHVIIKVSFDIMTLGFLPIISIYK